MQIDGIGAVHLPLLRGIKMEGIADISEFVKKPSFALQVPVSAPIIRQRVNLKPS
jgi:hypothetical protein